MGRARFSVRTLVGSFMIVAMLLGMSAGPASANHTAKITIHKAVCSSNTSDIFGKCHDNRLSGVAFRVAGVWRATNSHGVVSWGPGAGRHKIVEDWNVFSKYGAAYVFCSNQVTGAVLVNGITYDNVVTIRTTAGQAVICDWYNLT